MDETYWVQACPALVRGNQSRAHARRIHRTAGCIEAYGSRRCEGQDCVRCIRPWIFLNRRVLAILARKIRRQRCVLSFWLTTSYTISRIGLAESLQSEFMLYDIDVQICFPGTIYSPGFIEENRVKPKVTLKIEERDEGAKPEVVAAGVLKGMLTQKLP